MEAGHLMRMAGLLSALGLAALSRFGFSVPGGFAGQVALALGMVLIASFFAGRAAAARGLPFITGCLLMGMLFGPYLLPESLARFSVLDHRAIASLSLLDAVALGLIALSAGGELRFSEVKARYRAISGVALGQGVLVVGGICAALWFGRDWFPTLAGSPARSVLAMGLLLGVTALANSPATVMAILQEENAQGPMSQLVLGVTVLKDLLVITLFSLVLPLASWLTQSADASAGAGATGLLIAWEIGGSLAAGLALGWLVVQYLNRVGYELPLLVLGTAFAASTVLPTLHLSGLLACMVAGIYIENFSGHGERLIKAIEHHALPVYVVFFTLAGAGLDVNALRETWPLALFLGVFRLGLTALGTGLGAWLGGMPAPVVRHAWSGFIAQAGVALGFVVLIEAQLPELSTTLRPLILALVALNQITGPVLFRLGLIWAGESEGSRG